MLPLLQDGPYSMKWDAVTERTVGAVNAINALSSFSRSQAGDVILPEEDIDDEFPFLTETVFVPDNLAFTRLRLNKLIGELDQFVPAGGRRALYDPARRVSVKNASGYRLRQTEYPFTRVSKVDHPTWRKLVKDRTLKHDYEWDYEIQSRLGLPESPDEVRFATLQRRSTTEWGGKVLYELGVGYRIPGVFSAEEKLLFHERSAGVCEVQYCFEFARAKALARFMGLKDDSVAELALALSFAIHAGFADSRVVKIGGFDATTDGKFWPALRLKPDAQGFAFSTDAKIIPGAAITTRSQDASYKRITPRPGALVEVLPDANGATDKAKITLRFRAEYAVDYRLPKNLNDILWDSGRVYAKSP